MKGYVWMDWISILTGLDSIFMIPYVGVPALHGARPKSASGVYYQ